jgi:hypothetical protein
MRTQRPQERSLMRSVLLLLGIILIAIAAVYFWLPADSLPSFFPGHEAGLPRIRTKHGIAAGVAGAVLILIGWLIGRKP